MFDFFISFTRKRTIKEAFILYASHLLAGLTFIFIFVYMLHHFAPLNYKLQSYLANLGAIFYVTWLSFRVMKSKCWDFKNTILTLSSAILSIVGGLIFGLIPLTYAMTLEAKRSNE